MKQAVVIALTVATLSAMAQFPEVNWEYPVGAPSFGSAAAADLDNDGFYEIVFTTYTNDGRAHCINAEDGSVKWIYDIGGCGDVAPLIYDVTNDGNLDVIINGSCNPWIFCIDGASGDLHWSEYSGGGDSPPTVADMDQDGLPEILFGNFTGQIAILNGEDGSIAQTIQAVWPQSALQTEPIPIDINSDGTLEIIACNYFNTSGLFVWAFDYGTGDVIWENEVQDPDADFHAYHAGAVADVDDDGLMEYVVSSGAGYVQAINVEDGSELWKVDIPESCMSALQIADLDDDGELEVVFNNNDWITFDERIWILNGADGAEEWSFPIVFPSFRGMSISDIDGNGTLDLVSAHFMGGVMAVEPYNGEIWQVDLLDYFESENLPYFEATFQPLLADFDQNGTMDVFVAGGYGTYEPDAFNTGSAFMIEAGEGTCPEWLMFRQDVLRSGYLSEDEIVESCEAVSVTEFPEGELNFDIYPNPNDGAFILEMLSSSSDWLILTIHDVTGSMVHQERIANSGSLFTQTPVNISRSISAGVYTIQIVQGDGLTGTLPLVIR